MGTSLPRSNLPLKIGGICSVDSLPSTPDPFFRKKATKDSGVAVHWNLNPVSTATLSGEERKSPSYHGRFKAGEKTKAIFQRPAGWKNKVPC